MQTNDSIFYPWGEINTVHEWQHNDTIETTNVEPFHYNDGYTIGIGTTKGIIALALYVIMLGVILYYQK